MARPPVPAERACSDEGASFDIEDVCTGYTKCTRVPGIKGRSGEERGRGRGGGSGEERETYERYSTAVAFSTNCTFPGRSINRRI